MNALPEAIRIAIGAPLSGSAAARGAEMKQAIELAVEEQNADGGIAGLPILLEAADDKGKVETGGKSRTRFAIGRTCLASLATTTAMSPSLRRRSMPPMTSR